MLKNINKKRTIAIAVAIICVNILLGVIINMYYHESFSYQFNMTSDNTSEIKVYQASEVEAFSEENVIAFSGIQESTPLLLSSTIPTAIQYIRIDFDETLPSINKISDFNIYKGENHQNAMENIESRITLNQCTLEVQENMFTVTANGNDPYILIELDSQFIADVLNNNTSMLVIMMLFAWLIADVMLLSGVSFAKDSDFIKAIYKNRRLIWNLSKNDFKTKYAGSFFGVVWAFIQPVVTIVLYWFVFQVGLRSGDVGDVPFVLWLMCGLVPWFFFQDSIMAVTNSMVEYSYLVKKMVFQIDILPIVKVISALFVHLFFIGFVIVVFCLMGYFPTVTAIQLVYYLFCSIVLVLGIGYATCALVLFFKDLSQVIQIVLQIGMWMTPIMWNIKMLPLEFQWIMELNPMYYIVTGFRDSLITNTWVWNRLDMTINFWLITIVLFAMGNHVYKKLKCHFADVL